MQRKLQLARSMLTSKRPLFSGPFLNLPRRPRLPQMTSSLLALSLAAFLLPGPAWMHWLVSFSGLQCQGFACSTGHCHANAPSCLGCLFAVDVPVSGISESDGTSAGTQAHAPDFSGSSRLTDQLAGEQRDCLVCQHFAKQLLVHCPSSIAGSEPIEAELDWFSFCGRAALLLGYSPRGPPGCS